MTDLRAPQDTDYTPCQCLRRHDHTSGCICNKRHTHVDWQQGRRPMTESEREAFHATGRDPRP